MNTKTIDELKNEVAAASQKLRDAVFNGVNEEKKEALRRKLYGAQMRLAEKTGNVNDLPHFRADNT